MRKYWCVLNVALNERLVYRTDFFLGTLMRFTPIITTILLWRAVYRGAGASQLGGLSYQSLVGYYLLTMVSRAFSSMPGLAASIARDVREGTIQKYLVQPINPIGYLLMTRVAHKLVYYGVAAGPFVLVFFLCRRFLPGMPPAPVFAGYLASLVMAFLLGYFFELSVGMLSFWFLEISSFMFIIMSLNYFLSGHMVPLDLLPDPVSAALRLLPFQYLAYFPSMVILGKVSGWQLAGGLVLQAGWVALFCLISWWLYRRGLRRYSAFGG